MGVCSNCNKVTAFVQKNSTHTQGPSTNVTTNTIYKYPFPLSSTGSNLTILQTKTNVVEATFSKDIQSPELVYPQSFIIPLDVNGSTDPELFRAQFPLDNGTLIPPFFNVFGLLRTQWQEPNVGSVLEANICALSLCARRYSASVVSGRYVYTVLEEIYSNITTLPGNATSYTFTNEDGSFTYRPQEVFEQGSDLVNEVLRGALSTSMAGNLTYNQIEAGNFTQVLSFASNGPVSENNIIYGFN